MFNSIKSTLATGAVASLLFVSAFSFADVNETLRASAGGTLDLKTDAGKLIIDTHNEDSVILDVTLDGKNADDMEVTFETDGTNVTIRGDMDSKWGWGSSIRAEFRVTVPENYNLELDTSGGSIRIKDLTGDVDAHTSGGSIKVGSITGRVKLDTSGGSISTEAIHGPLNAHTSGGSIDVTIAEQLTENAVLDTSGGSISAYIVEDAQIDLDASTSGGRVRTDFDVDGKIKKRSIRGEINGGGPTLKLRTSGGSISIKSL